MKNLKSLILLILLFTLNKLTKAQIPVFEEPRHKVVLQNEYVRLLDVHVRPHDTTLYHRHSIPSAIVFLSRNVTGSQVMGGEINIGQVIPGNTAFADFANKPVSHRVWNEDTSVYHVMDIEIFPRVNTFVCNIINEPAFKLAWDQKNIRAYNLTIEPGKTSIVKGVNCPHLFILISGSAHSNSADNTQKINRELKPGDFIWYPAGLGFEIINDGAVNTDCVLLELK